MLWNSYRESPMADSDYKFIKIQFNSLFWCAALTAKWSITDTAHKTDTRITKVSGN